MKKLTIFFIYAIFICFSNRHLFAQQMTNQQQNTFNRIDFNTVVDSLFDSPQIDVTKKNGFIWKPNYYESCHFNLSFDNKCHTSLDTLLKFKNTSLEEGLIFIFKTQTYTKTGEIIGSHFSRATVSVAVFLKTSWNCWSLNSFCKYFTDSGLFGGNGKEGIGKFSIVKINNEILLSMKRPVEGNNGYNEGIEDLYFIDGDLPCDILHHIFRYNYFTEENLNITKKHVNLKKSTKDVLIVTNYLGNEEKYLFSTVYCKFLINN
jgi:hypothetical protein